MRISVPLPDTAGFEERPMRVSEVDDALCAWVLDGKQNKPALLVRRQRPVCALSDAALERARTALLAQWHKRVQELQAFGLVKAKGVKLAARVSLVSVGVESVELTLELGGTASLMARTNSL